uniref:Putative ribonuclease H-like domain-containing protein n=1 Tax=Tanacetum cinerariifolium TaxID=118510 RepID=A0A6L2K2I6_TANCI|nr:putative ribonuclease H-like domain-containing protein [Tanacetum cinerariifolium]
MRPFGCHVTILNTLDHLGKLDRKSDDGFFIRYSLNSKAFRVYNIKTRKLEENLHIRFLENKPIIVDGSLFDSSSKNANNDEPQPSSDFRKKNDDGITKESGINDQERLENNTQDVNTVGPSINTVNTNVNTGSLNINTVSPSITTALLEATHADLFGDEIEVDMSNISTTYLVPSTLNTRIHKDHSIDHVIGDVQFGVQRMRLTKTTSEQGFISVVYEGKTHKDHHTCMFACFLSQEEPKKVWTLANLPYGKRAIGTKWIYRNKKDERGIVVRNKARLVAQGHTQEQGIDYDDVFALIEKEVYVCQPLAFEDLEFPDRVYKVKKALYGLYSQYTYGDLKAMLKDAEAKVVDVYLYRSMIESLMYLTASRPDIMFAICVYERFQVTRKVSHLHAMERIFRYLKGQPKLGLWYLKDSPFDLKAYTNSNYAGASLDRKSITEGCQFIRSRLISWQCKKQTVVANSTTEAEYVATASCSGQVLWIQNQMLVYGYNFMNTKIFIDNESTICIVKNLVFHSKTKHVEMRHHFIKDSNEKKLIQMIKIHIDQNFVDLLTKVFDVGRFQYVVISIGMLNF